MTILTQNWPQLGLYESYSRDTCTKQGVFEAAQFNGAIKIYHRPTLVAMATKIWEF